jgi:phosphonate transport system substrate-binding protein
MKNLKMNLKKIIIIQIISLLFYFFYHPAFANCLGDQTAPKTYSFFVVPQFPSTQIYNTWGPLLDRVGKSSHQCYTLEFSASIPDFEAHILKGNADFAFMNPYHLLIAHNSQGYDALLADSKEKLFGIVVVKKSSGAQSIKDLNGQKVGYPSPNAFGASLLVRSELAKEKVQTTSLFLKTHTNVYRSVIIGDVKAGGGIYSTFEKEPIEVRDQLKIIYKTSQYNPHPIVAGKRVPGNERDMFVQSFLGLQKDAAGQAMLNAVLISTPKPVNYDDDYQLLEKLGLDKFVAQPNAN